MLMLAPPKEMVLLVASPLRRTSTEAKITSCSFAQDKTETRARSPVPELDCA